MANSPSSPVLTDDQRKVLCQAIADAVYYRDPPVQCSACSPEDLCGECSDGFTRALSYLELRQTLGLEPV
jgi:hypothetical protein